MTEVRVPVFHVHHNQDIELYYAKVREDKVYLKNAKVAQFTNSGVFTVKDERRKKKGKFKALLYLDGKATATEIKSEEDYKKQQEKNAKDPSKLQTIPDSQESLLEPLTDNDRKQVVKREVAKQLAKSKVMQTWQFVVLIGLGACVLAIQLIGLLT